MPRRVLAFGRRREGNILLTLGLALPALVGMLGLGVETGVWYLERRQAQTQADAGAMAGAYSLAGGFPSEIESSARSAVSENGAANRPTATVTVNNPPTSGPYDGNASAVEVIVTIPEERTFSSLFASGTVSISGRAVALIKQQGDACVLAINVSTMSADKIGGSTAVNLGNCAIAANSNNASAITISGNASLSADSLWTAGGYTVTNGATLNLTHGATTHGMILEDPFASLTIPTLAPCQNANIANKGVTTLNPGVYCNGISIGAQATVVLNAGTYYIDKGDFTVNGGATVSCNCPNAGDGVTIVLTTSGSDYSKIGSVTINGGANVTLSAPTKAAADANPAKYPYPGVLFFRDRRADNTGTAKLNGGSTMRLGGALYFPTQGLQFNGNNSTSVVKCTHIVADTVTFTGNSSFDNSGCADAGYKTVKLVSVTLVE